MRDNLKAFGRSAVLFAAVAGGLAAGACEKQVREAKAPDAAADAPRPVMTARRVPADASAEPTTAAAHVANARKPAETQPALTLLMIDGLAVQFPHTKLLLNESSDDVLAAELYSDLPKSALRNYAGNEMYLEVKLQPGEGPQKVDGASWTFKAERSGKSDSVNGIFLNGQQTHLQPSHVMLRFEQRKDGLYAALAGQFRAFEDHTPESLAPFVTVQGEIPVEVVQKR